MTEWIVSSSVLVLVVVLLRQVLKGKLSLRLQYALWALVLVRLLVPFSFGVSRYSVTRAVGELPVRQDSSITIADPPSKLFNTEWVPESAISEPDPSLPEDEREQQYQENKQKWEDEQDAAWEHYKAENTKYVTLAVTDVLRGIWIAGMAVMALWLLAANLRFWLRLRRSRRVLNYMPLVTYVSGAVETPCLFGLFKPAIYVTPEAAEDDVTMGHIMAHEMTHYRHRDYIWAVLRCVCLVIHWYNPLVWLAAALSRRDAELACDESTLLRIGEGERAAYGRTLIGLTCTGKGGLLRTATTMTGSKKSIRERIVLIAKKPKMRLYTLIAVLLIAAIAVGCTYTGSASISDWAEDLSAEDLQDTVKLSDIRSGKNYPLSDADREELLTILRGIGNDQILKNVPKEAMEPGNYGYDYMLSYSTGNDVQVLSSISFSFLDNGAIGVSCFGDLGYLTGLGSDWKWLDSPELYRFMAERFALPKVSDAEHVSYAAMHYAEQVIGEHVADLQVQGIDAQLHSVLALAMESTGTAGANTGTEQPPSLEVYRLSYCLDGLEGGYGTFANFTRYLFIFMADGVSTLVKTADMRTLTKEYLSTPEMQEKYNGNTLEAAAIELFEACMEERNGRGETSGVPDVPAAPSGGLSEIAKRGDTISLTLYTAAEGKRSTFTFPRESYGWYDTNQLTGTQWLRLSEAPEGEWDYWLTYTSADGEVSVTFYHGENGPVKYEDGENTVWWQVRPNFWNGRSDAETLRQVIYDNLETSTELLPAFSVASARDAVWFFAESVWGDYLMSTTPGSIYHVLDYKVLSWSVEQISTDGNAVVGAVRYAVLPEDYTASGLWAGNTEAGIGEYEGWLVMGREFMLERQADGLWHCLDLGTGGVMIENRGYQKADLTGVTVWDAAAEALNVAAAMENAVFYALFDLNHDGQDELIVETGTFELDRMYHFFACVNGNVVEIGVERGTHSRLASDGRDLIIAAGHMDCEQAYRITWKDGVFESVLLFDRVAGEDGYTKWPVEVEENYI